MPLSDCAGTVLTVDLNALATNFKQLRQQLRGASLHAVVKADAYGLGMARVAPTLAAQGCQNFFVATLEEGVALRALLPDAEIGVFDGFLPGEETAYAAHRLVPFLNDFSQVERFSGQPEGQIAGLHIDTGMARLGLGKAEVDRLAAEPRHLAGKRLSAILSHLACADTPSHPKNAEQRDFFKALSQTLPTARLSLANSSGIFLGPEYHFDFARAGAAIYGLNPQPKTPNPMTQVLTLQGKILQLRDIDSPQTVGYGATYRAEGPRRIATVAIGYADGYLRTLGDRGTCFIGDRQVPVIGRVSMDLITIDVTGIPFQQIAPGAFVELIGPHHSIDALAAQAGTIGYELLTTLGRRGHRTYTGEA